MKKINFIEKIPKKEVEILLRKEIISRSLSCDILPFRALKMMVMVY